MSSHPNHIQKDLFRPIVPTKYTNCYKQMKEPQELTLNSWRSCKTFFPTKEMTRRCLLAIATDIELLEANNRGNFVMSRNHQSSQ